MVMKTVRRLLYVFASFFEPDLAESSIVVVSFWTYWLVETSLIYSVTQFGNKTQMIVHGQEASNINFSTVVLNFDVCRLS